MGSSHEQPIHQVKVPQFWMGKYSVTQEQWRRIMGNNPSAFKGDKRPVECVSWNDAVEFCQKLTQYTGKEFRLPSEAEWEYACRAGSETSYCFGEDSSRLKEYACYGRWVNGHDPVGQKKPNAWGLYDMHGNVWEWCADDWHKNYNRAPNDGSIWLSNSNARVIRGGSWSNNANSCRCAYRGSCARGSRYNNNGFRVFLGFLRTT
jgi:formylglycine-generating enzyme required for sulfatase activity